MRFRLLPLFAVIALSQPAHAQSFESGGLTRIEPRNFYGASITKEAGVHVYRTLPPTQNYIINPGHKTPLNLTIENRTERFFTSPINGQASFASGVPVDSVASGFIGSPFGFGFGFDKGRRNAAATAGGFPTGRVRGGDTQVARQAIQPPSQRPVRVIKPAAVKPAR